MQATYDNFRDTANLPDNARNKLLQSLSKKTFSEQVIVFRLKHKIFSKIRTKSASETEYLQRLKRDNPAGYDYIILMLAIRMHITNQTKSEYIAEIREARQDKQSKKTVTLYRAVEVLLPLIDELRETGATWADVANVLNKKQRKILCYKKLTVDYLKKAYGKIKKERAESNIS